MSSPPVPAPPPPRLKRVAPPCWTQEETLALIQAYRDKWFSVNRGNLRAADWDAVAAAVSAHISNNDNNNNTNNNPPPKSSLQCRHKIEKLRKRYRMEKKRCLDYPGRFFSSWVLFPLLDAMSIGSSPVAPSSSSKRCRFQHKNPNNIDRDHINSNDDTGDGSLDKMLGRDRYNLVTKPNNCGSTVLVDDEGFDCPDVNNDLGLDQDLIFRDRKCSSRVDDNISEDNFAGDLGKFEFCMKNQNLLVGDINSVSVAFRRKDYYCPRSSVAADGSKFNVDVDCKSDYYMKMENPVGPARLKAYGKNSAAGEGGGDSRTGCRNVIVEDVDGYVGFPIKTLGDMPTVFNSKFHRAGDDSKSYSNKFGYDLHCTSDTRERFGENNGISNGFIPPPPPPPGFRQKNYYKTDGSSKLDVNFKILNGIGDVKKSGIDNTSVKEVMDPVAELASAIRLSTENFLKVEKMKMEMTMEIEKMRMETMLKHNQMILESQQQVVDAFVKTGIKKKEKKKRKELEVLSPYEDKNGETQVAAIDSESIGRSGIAKEECGGGFI